MQKHRPAHAASSLTSSAAAIGEQRFLLAHVGTAFFIVSMLMMTEHDSQHPGASMRSARHAHHSTLQPHACTMQAYTVHVQTHSMHREAATPVLTETSFRRTRTRELCRSVVLVSTPAETLAIGGAPRIDSMVHAYCNMPAHSAVCTFHRNRA